MPASQCVPQDPDLWELRNCKGFLPGGGAFRFAEDSGSARSIVPGDCRENADLTWGQHAVWVTWWGKA